jgi:hypothetical protein
MNAMLFRHDRASLFSVAPTRDSGHLLTMLRYPTASVFRAKEIILPSKPTFKVRDDF